MSTDVASGVSTLELNFGLVSVILGLALAHMANALRKLMLRGRQVAWAPEPLMQAYVIAMIIVSVWMNQFGRNQGALTDAEAVLNLLRMLTLYFAAGFCLPEPEPGEEHIDLLAYHERTRRFSYGALAAGLIVFWIYNSVVSPAHWRDDLIGKLIPTGLWVVLMFVRWRWLTVLILLVSMAGTTWDIVGPSLAR